MGRLPIAVAGLVLLLGGCTTSTSTGTDDAPQGNTATATSELLAEQGLAGRSVEEVIAELDAMPLEERPTDLMASVRPDELVLSDGTDEAALALPEGRFYLSVAPYVDTTHECFHHSLTTCTGELGGEEVGVRVTTDDGEVILDETRTTYANGFVGVWLPRGVEGTLEVAYGDLSGSTEIATRPDSPTCLTTLQMT